MTTRRLLLTGLGALICAPAIVRASSIMPVKSWDDCCGAVILQDPDFGRLQLWHGFVSRAQMNRAIIAVDAVREAEGFPTHALRVQFA